MSEQSPTQTERDQLRAAFVGSAESATLELKAESWRGVLIVGDKRFVLRVGITLTSLALLVCLWLLLHNGFFAPLVFLIVLTFSGLLVFISRLRTAPHVLRMDEAGLDDRTDDFSPGFIPWDDIEGFSVVRADGRPMLGVSLNEGSRGKQSLLVAARMGAQRKETGVDLVLPPEVFGLGDPGQYVEFLEHFRSQPEARKQLRSEGL